MLINRPIADCVPFRKIRGPDNPLRHNDQGRLKVPYLQRCDPVMLFAISSRCSNFIFYSLVVFIRAVSMGIND
jgi:hypothetical protein